MRSWALPYFGVNNTSLVGAPPDVLSLSAYSTGPQDTANSAALSANQNQRPDEPAGPQNRNLIKRERATNINNIPVVLQQISIPYPSDVDYIDTVQREFGDTVIEGGVPFPTLMTVDLQLLETKRESADG